MKNKDINSINFLIIVLFLFFILRLPSLIEPHWYGDEGIYQVIGMALNNDRSLYSQAWDNKPPLLYLLYALARSDQFTIRALSAFIGMASVIPFYYLAKLLFNSLKIVRVLTVLYLFFFATPILEGNIANAENFMLFPILASAYYVYTQHILAREQGYASFFAVSRRKIILFSAGILLGMAFLFKIVALFDFLAFSIFLVIVNIGSSNFLNEIKGHYKKLISILIFFCAGFVIPAIISLIYFTLTGGLYDYIYAVFLNNIGYVGESNNLIIAQGFLIVKLILLASSVGVIIWKRKILLPGMIFVFLWFLFSLFSVWFSGRDWTHYMILIIPVSLLALGLALDKNYAKAKITAIACILIIIYTAASHFKISLYSFQKVSAYYENYLMYVGNRKDHIEYQKFFDGNVPRDYEIADFLKKKSSPKDAVFIWGNSPQIHTLSDTLPPGRFIVKYHIENNENAIDETSRDLIREKPRFIVILSEGDNIPFSLTDYTYNYNINGSAIYEKTN